MIKKVILAVALAASVATPALAAVGAHQTRQEKPWEDASPFIHKPSFDVYKDGVYVGSDPDPRVRVQLLQDYETN
jgi:uncharacterized protein with FMN-binding domain